MPDELQEKFATEAGDGSGENAGLGGIKKVHRLDIPPTISSKSLVNMQAEFSIVIDPGNGGYADWMAVALDGLRERLDHPYRRLMDMFHEVPRWDEKPSSATSVQMEWVTGVINSHAHGLPMPKISNAGPEPTLYVCRDCGDGIEDPEDRRSCPTCGGRLINSSVPHDD